MLTRHSYQSLWARSLNVQCMGRPQGASVITATLHDWACDEDVEGLWSIPGSFLPQVSPGSGFITSTFRLGSLFPVSSSAMTRCLDQSGKVPLEGFDPSLVPSKIFHKPRVIFRKCKCACRAGHARVTGFSQYWR